MLTTSTNRNLLQPTKANQKKRESNIQKDIEQGKHHITTQLDDGKRAKSRPRVPLLGSLVREESSSSSSSSESARSQLVDLMVEDKDAEEVERVRARKEGGAAWNETDQKHFM